MQTITLTAAQISPIIEVGPGTRITSTGNGNIAWVAGSLADANNGSGTWANWPKGTSSGSVDVVRRMCIRATATGAMTVTIEEGKRDDAPDGAYWDSEIVTSQTVNGVTSLVGAGGVLGKLRLPIGEFYGRAASYLEVPSATPTVMEFDDVIVDTLGIYSSSTKEFTLPAEVISLDWEVMVEMANSSTGYGNLLGSRSISLPAAYGMGTITYPTVQQTGAAAGGGIIRGCGFSVPWDHGVMGDLFNVKFTQNSGSVIRVGDSTGTASVHTLFKLKLYAVE